MKSFKNFMFAVMIISAVGLFAKGKNLDRAYFSNFYGEDVSVTVEWKKPGTAFGYYYKPQEFTLNIDEQDVERKAPGSGYALDYISVMPKSSARAQGLANLLIEGATSQIHGIAKGFNSADIDSINGNTFFVVEAEKVKNKGLGSKKIILKKYKSKEHFEKENKKDEKKEMKEEMVA